MFLKVSVGRAPLRIRPLGVSWVRAKSLSSQENGASQHQPDSDDQPEPIQTSQSIQRGQQVRRPHLVSARRPRLI